MSDPTSNTFTPSRSANVPQTPHARRWLQLWRIVTWALLLLAAFGVVQYAGHAWRVWHVLGQSAAAQRGALERMLWWDGGYLLLAGLTVTVAAGTLMRRDPARRGLRVMALVLAAWALATAIMLVLQWDRFQHAAQMLLAQPGLSAQQRAGIVHLQRTLITGMVLKFAVVPVLVWLSWRLGRPSVRRLFTRGQRPPGR